MSRGAVIGLILVKLVCYTRYEKHESISVNENEIYNKQH